MITLRSLCAGTAEIPRWPGALLVIELFDTRCIVVILACCVLKGLVFCLHRSVVFRYLCELGLDDTLLELLSLEAALQDREHVEDGKSLPVSLSLWCRRPGGYQSHSVSLVIKDCLDLLLIDTISQQSSFKKTASVHRNIKVVWVEDGTE